MNYERSRSTGAPANPGLGNDPGWFSTMGVALIICGCFYVLISLFTVLVMAGAQPMPGFGQPVVEGSLDEGVAVSVRNLIEGAMTLQLLLGGILGLATIWAGVLTRRRQSRETVKWVSIANLLYFPIGTTVGALVLIGLGRDSVKRGFAAPGPERQPAASRYAAPSVARGGRRRKRDERSRTGPRRRNSQRKGLQESGRSRSRKA